MRTYATAEDLAAEPWNSTPTNAASLLRSASTLIEAKTLTAIYRTTPDGYPASAAVRNIFKDAACAQASYWAANDLDPAAGPVKEATKRQAASKSIGGASISFESSQSGAQARVAALTELSPEAYNILNNVGLLNGLPVLL